MVLENDFCELLLALWRCSELNCYILAAVFALLDNVCRQLTGFTAWSDEERE